MVPTATTEDVSEHVEDLSFVSIDSNIVGIVECLARPEVATLQVPYLPLKP